MPKPIEESLWIVEREVMYEGSTVLDLIAGPPVAVRKYVLRTYCPEGAKLDDFEYNDGPKNAPTSFVMYLPPYDVSISITRIAITDLLKGKRG